MENKRSEKEIAKERYTQKSEMPHIHAEFAKMPNQKYLAIW